LERLGEIALVVLGLDDTDAEWLDRGDTEERFAGGPQHDELHDEGGLADTGTAGQDDGGSLGEPAIAHQIVGIVGWIEPGEVLGGDDGGIVLGLLDADDPVLPSGGADACGDQALAMVASLGAGKAGVAGWVLVLGIDAGDV